VYCNLHQTSLLYLTNLYWYDKLSISPKKFKLHPTIIQPLLSQSGNKIRIQKIYPINHDKLPIITKTNIKPKFEYLFSSQPNRQKRKTERRQTTFGSF
jgi:hypothetical protein